MKRWTLESCGLLLLLVLPLLAGCDQQQARSAPVSNSTADTSTSQPPADVSLNGSNVAAFDGTNQDLSDAPGTILSTPATAPSTNANPQLNEVVKLAQAGVDDSILMAYVTNSPSAFNLSSDDIIYLNDLGVAQSVVNAMLQRDQYFNSIAAAQPPAQPASPPEQQTPPPDITQTPATDQNAQAPTVEAPPSDVAVTPPLTPPDDVVSDAAATQNGSYTYFYDSLAPYGNWINIDGYGPCWQPTVVVANPGWQPYCDSGYWTYTDCGWCWVSNYSWGWAPFHYGRWFHHRRWGWCWAPDVVWGPAWVSWRYNSGYCGWAPLPPAACYRPGFGFTFFGQPVGFNFTFGLSANFFVFVPLNHFHDQFPTRFRLPHREVTKIYNTTVINNQIIRGNNNTIINRGVPVDRVAAASHTQIRPIHIRAENQAPGSARLNRDGRTLAVYRPALPAPRPSGKPRLAGEGVPPARNFDLRSRVERTSTPAYNGAPQQRPLSREIAPNTPERRPIISTPTQVAPREPMPPQNPANENRFSRTPENPVYRPGPGRNNNYVPNQAPSMNRQPVIQQPRSPAPYWQQPSAPAPRQEFTPSQGLTPRQDLQPRQDTTPRQNWPPRQELAPRQELPPRQEVQPRQEAPPRNYESPHNYQPRSAPPAPSAPSHQENNSQNGNWNGGGRGH